MDPVLESVIRAALEFVLDEHRDEGPARLNAQEEAAARQWLAEHPVKP